MFKIFKKKNNEKKTLPEFDYYSASFSEIIRNEKKWELYNFDYNKYLFSRSVVKWKLRDDYLNKAREILKSNNFIVDVDIPKDVSIRNIYEAVEIFGLEYIKIDDLKKSYEIGLILFKLNDFGSCHFYFNAFVAHFYKYRNQKEYKEKVFHICKLDFAITSRYMVLKDAILPCVSKLVQMLEKEKKYDDALFIINHYKDNGFMIQYQNEFVAKKNRIKNKKLKEDKQ